MRDVIRGVRGLDIVAADLMELGPVYDPTGMSACLAAGIAFELRCLLAEARHRRTGAERVAIVAGDLPLVTREEVTALVKAGPAIMDVPGLAFDVDEPADVDCLRARADVRYTFLAYGWF